MTTGTTTESTQDPRNDQEVLDRLRESVAGALPSSIADLSALVRIPSVSWSAFDAAEVARSAEAVAELARGLGVFDEVSVRRSAIDGGAELG